MNGEPSRAAEKETKNNRDECVGKPSEIDAYGFIREEDFDYKSYEEFESEYVAVLSRRSKRWNEKMKKEKYKHDSKTKRFCRKGIPAEYRCRVWMDISGANKKMKNHPGEYQRLLSTVCADSNIESDLQDAIDTDLARTFPDNIHFRNDSRDDQKVRLRNLLLAYGRHSPAVGYCQGMNYVAAMIILVVKEEENSFWLMCALIDDILPPYYGGTLVGARTEVEVLADLVRSKYPEVDAKLNEVGVTWMVFVSKWFICLFVDVVPIDTVLRIWDCLFYEGSKILFRAALTIVHDKTAAIAQCQSLPDFIDTFRPIRNESSTLSCHLFMEKCFTVPDPLSKKNIAKLREKNEKLVLEEDAKYIRKKR